MQSPWLSAVLAVAAMLSSAAFVANQIDLKDKRGSVQDLKLSGDLPGLPAGSVRYVSYDDLSHLPRVTFQVSDDPNFPGTAEITGVYLDELMRTLGIPDKGTMIAAVCDDQYEAHYTDDYRSAHRPILVLLLNGRALAQYKRTRDDGTFGPYLVSHATFKPRYNILAHAEEAQIPNGVVALRFLKQDEVLDSILPHGAFAKESLEMQGYRIAEQNCFRCHNAGDYGGHKADRSWQELAHIAQTDPKGFAAYIKDPEGQDPTALMPANPEYDAATLHALTAYFQTFAIVSEIRQASK